MSNFEDETKHEDGDLIPEDILSEQNGLRSKQEYPLPVERVLSWYPSVTERYYLPKFFIPTPQIIETMNSKTANYVTGDQCVLFHSNRVAVVTLAPSHPVIRDKLQIISIDFSGGRNTDRLANKVSGKRKRGGQQLVQESVICTLKTICESTNEEVFYPIFAAMKGSLIEINEKLNSEPQLLVEQPWSHGYIAMILSKIHKIEETKNLLLSPEEYKKVLEERKITD